MINTQKSDQGVRPAEFVKINYKENFARLRVATLNVGTMKGHLAEIVEMLTRRNIDICCLQETKWKGESARRIMGKDSQSESSYHNDEIVDREEIT